MGSNNLKREGEQQGNIDVGCETRHYSRIAMEKLKEMLTEKDQDEMENENDMKMKQGEMKLSKFGFGFELTGFVAFLSWTGMCLFSLLGVVSVLLIALLMEPYFQNHPKSFDRDEWNMFELVSVLMQVFGSVFLVIAVGYFIMNFFLRKKNRDNNFQGVKKMLTVICSLSAVLMILVVSAILILIIYDMMNGIIFPTYHFSMIYLVPDLVFWCLLLHGIRKERSGFVKAFLVFKYTIFGLFTVCMALSSAVAAVGYSMFIVFPCGILYIMTLTFIFVFNIGFYVALHSIYLENEKTQQLKKKNIEFINASFENCYK